jgi:hypothetical protein
MVVGAKSVAQRNVYSMSKIVIKNSGKITSED